MSARLLEVTVVLFLVAIGYLLTTMAPRVTPRYPGAGPVLVDAIEEGWEPPLLPPEPESAVTEVVHSCEMCGVSCCTKCNACTPTACAEGMRK